MEYLIVLEIILVNGIQIVAFPGGLVSLLFKKLRETGGEEGADLRWAVV